MQFAIFLDRFIHEPLPSSRDFLSHDQFIKSRTSCSNYIAKYIYIYMGIYKHEGMNELEGGRLTGGGYVNHYQVPAAVQVQEIQFVISI